MKSTLLKNVFLDGKNVDILVSGDRIAKIGHSGLSDVPGDTEVVECSGKAVLPGLVNMHTHAGMAMMRGVGEDIPFHEWLDRIWVLEKGLDEEYVYHATKVACLEMIKTGTTAFNDQYWYMPMACKAASEMGIRAALSYVVCDRNDPEESERQKDQCVQMYEDSKTWSDMMTFMIQKVREIPNMVHLA